MQRRHLTIACGAFLGCCLGLVFYHFQSAEATNINFFGVVSLASLGTSCGCLLAEPGEDGWF
jgi:hypothetical protein